jgi:hypothetical protein
LVGVDPNNVHPGDTFNITGTGLPPGALLGAELHSTPVSLGSTTVSPTGAFSLNVAVPSDVELGAHTIVVTLSGTGLTTTTKQQAIRVSAEQSSDPTTGGADVASGAPDAHLESETELAASDSNILTNSLKPIADVINDPARIPAAFAIGLVLLLLAVMPSHLLNITIGEQYERFARRMPILRAQPQWYTSLRAMFARAPVLGGLLLTTTTAFLFAFADPNFGLNLASLRLFLALAGALFSVTYLANAITAVVMRRGWGVEVSVQLRPLGLLLTVAGVIASRMLEFSPGFLIGLVLGLTIASKVAAQHAWKAVLIRTSVVTTFAFASWLLYSSMSAGVHHDPTFWNELALEFFVAVVTEGTVILLVELLPFHLLEGERLYLKSRVLWASAYLVLLTLFILAVVPWAGNWRELGPSFWPWFTAVGIFAAVCVAIYLYFRFLAEPLHHDGHPGDGSEDINADERVAVGDDS